MWRVARSFLERTGLANLRVGSFSIRRTKGYVQDTLARILALVHPGPAMVRGHRMYLSTGPRDFAVDMLMGSFEDGTTAVFERVLRPGMCAIDLGAHIGYFTLLAARLVGPTGRVYSFEPAPETYRILEKNVALNGYQNVLAVQKAVADRAGAMTLQLSRAGSPSHSLFEDKKWGGGYVRVDVTTLDEFLESQGWPHVHLIKMDIEGAEQAALAGMTTLLGRQADFPTLIVEFHPDNIARSGLRPDEFLAKLRKMGFRIRFIMGSEVVESVDVGELSANLWGGSRINLLCEQQTVCPVVAAGEATNARGTG